MNNNYIDYTIDCNYFNTLTSVDNEYRSHYKYELLLLLSNNVSVLINSKKYKTSYGTLILLSSHDLHLAINDTSSPYKRITIHFDPNLIRQYSTQNTNLLFCFQSKRNATPLLHLDNIEVDNFIQLATIFQPFWKSKKYGEDLLSITYLIQILILVNKIYLKGYTKKDVTFTTLISDTITYIDSHISEELNIKQIASKFAYSESYICTQFSQQVGISIKQYILGKKLAIAKQYLENDYSVTKTSELCGFNDYTNFIRTFNNHVGCSPTQWKKNFLKYSN